MKWMVLPFICLGIQCFAQETRYSENYDSPNSGVYLPLSTSDFNTDIIIKGERISIGQDSNQKFLSTNAGPIFLFSDMEENGKRQLLGKIIDSSFIRLIEKWYRSIYVDENNQITFEVWHKISINDSIYFIDVKPKDLYFYPKSLNKFDQSLILYFEQGGYDYMYDSGYPEKFGVLITDINKSIIQEIPLSDFNTSDEFWEAEYAFNLIEISKGYKIYLNDGTSENYYGTWNGKSLIRGDDQ